MNRESTVTVKHQVYQSSGKEVVLDESKKMDDGRLRYTVREIKLEQGRYVLSPAFHTYELSFMGRVVALSEAA